MAKTMTTPLMRTKTHLKKIETPFTRTKNHHLPLIKSRLNKQKFNVKTWRIKQTTPIKIDKLLLKRVIDEIEVDPNKNLGSAKQVGFTRDYYNNSRDMSFARCSHPSMEVFTFSGHSIFVHTASTLLHQLRLSLLSHDWNSCAKMLRILLPSELINRKLGIHIMRCVLMVFLNNSDRSEILEEFLTISLGLNDEKKINEFIGSLFTFPEDLKHKYVAKVLQ